MKNEDYAYAVARIRANERKMLTNADIESLLRCKSFDDAVKFLASKEWTQKNDGRFDIGRAIAENQKKLWALLCESVPDRKLLRVFTVQNDFFNLKAALKCSITSQSAERLFAFPTSLDVDLIVSAIESREFSKLGDDFASPVKEAYEAACQTQNGQNVDIILDRAAIICIQKLSEKSDCKLVKRISDFVCSAAVIKTAVRCARTQKSLSFAQSAIAPCASLDSKKLAELSVQGEENLLSFLEKTEFSRGVSLLRESTTAFEKWCDDTVTEMTKEAKFVFFGFEPICAYYYAKQAEFKTVRIILGSKQSGVSDEIIRERVRALYV